MSDVIRPSEANSVRYCLARDGKKWRVYDDQMMRFAEPSHKATEKDEARERARLLNQSAHTDCI